MDNKVRYGSYPHVLEDDHSLDCLGYMNDVRFGGSRDGGRSWLTKEWIKMKEKQKPLIAKIDGKEYEVLHHGDPASVINLYDSYQFRRLRTTSDLREVIKWLAADENNVAVDRLGDVYPDPDGGFTYHLSRSGKSIADTDSFLIIYGPDAQEPTNQD